MSTPANQDSLMSKIMAQDEQACIYKRSKLDSKYNENKIFLPKDVAKGKESICWEREYCLRYGGLQCS
ncbi:MAG: hypothetical protein M3044_08815 [Thermoproteota archaeon]|nr:hypothetical protein [Thermoproteota archaeon]